MKTDFLLQPPHPETEWAACTSYSETAKEITPVLDVRLGDTSICLSQDGWYYMTGTTALSDENSRDDGIMMWKSPNLRDWKQIGIVWNHSVCSPEIHQLRGTFWISYGRDSGGTGLLRSISGKVEGPYEDYGQITLDGTDASMFEDDDGQVYWVYHDGKIAAMRDDLSGLVEESRTAEVVPWKSGGRTDKPFRDNDKRVGTHGAFLTKWRGQYYLFCAESFNRMGCSSNEDTFVAVSDHINGPYSRRYLAVPHGGQATFFLDSNGVLHGAFTGKGSYSLVQDRPAVIQMVFNERGFIQPDAECILEKGAIGRLKPAGAFPIRDPQICLAPDGMYYMTGTSNQPNQDFWNGNDELHLWISQDLDHWEHAAKVWDLHIDGTWETNIYENPCLWAPEVIFIESTFWITYSLKGGSTGLLKSLSGKAEGPYVDMGRVTNTHIDSSIFQDDDGKVYYIWQDGYIARMKPNMSGFAETPRKLLDADGIPVGYEGAFIVKYKGKYILGAAEWHGDERVDGTYDLMYAAADHIYGPYSSRSVAVPHGGHGTMFIDREGRLLSTLFGNDRTAPFRARAGILELVMEMDEQEVRIRPAGSNNTSGKGK